jgi:F-type H+-transporting ATPase subunit b
MFNNIFYIILFMALFMPALNVSAQPLGQQPQDPAALDQSLTHTINADLINGIPVVDNSDPEIMSDVTAEKEAGLPQFDTTTFSSQLFWLLVTFIALYVYFSQKALPALSATIDSRKTTIKSDIDNANKISQEVDVLKADYEAAIAKAHDDARAARAAMEHDIREKSESEVVSFNEKSQLAIEDLEKRAEQAKQAIEDELKVIASQLSEDIVSKLSHLDINQAQVQAAVEKHMKGQPKSNERQKAA